MQQVDIEIMGTGDGSLSNEVIMLGKIKKETSGLEKCYRKIHCIFKKVSSTFNITKLSEFV